ncbi:uncharacterized protein LOC120352729 [Nilaparvata lugens]|uniref:uncharacterized protein LOC120352729 n=1 Tax=Nilaparvata lugens TaxID=108931 RepID=UPI00193E4033|nr:uncharacterized protein LOC120352729 [Nilaparvata lugens]
MSYVQTRWMRDRSTQIVSLSRYYWQILEYFAMPHHDYCQSLTDWYIWYLEMFPIFQQFATLYEQTKFDFDEKIRDTMGLIEDKRLELVDKIPLLNNLNDVSKISSYKQFVKRYLRDIEFITAKMDWVNNEEKIFNRTLTKFGMVEDLNNILLPFCKLIFKVYSWYQKQKTWFNNSFDLLVTEEVETTFDRYYNSLSQGLARNVERPEDLVSKPGKR